jgi:hypothetical protein
VNTTPESDATAGRELRRDRFTVILCLTALVVITAIVIQYSPSIGIRELTGLALVWVVLGYPAFFAASHAYSPPSVGPRPHLKVGRGMPAWAFFLVGSTVLGGISLVWLLSLNYRSGLLLVGLTIMYGSIAFPRPLSLRRASLSGIGLLVSGIGLVFF